VIKPCSERKFQQQTAPRTGLKNAEARDQCGHERCK
jgi:hypothetical protein